MIYLLVSIFGLFMNYLIVYRLEKIQFRFFINKHFIFLCLSSPMTYFLVFKDHFTALTLYIGLILVSLTFFHLYFLFFLKSAFYSAHIRVLDLILLNLKMGHSFIKSAELTFNSLNKYEKIVFEQLLFIHEVNLHLSSSFIKKVDDVEIYFNELKRIFSTQVHIHEQIHQFRRGLAIKKSLRQKSRSATLQVRAQAIIAVIIHVFLTIIVFDELNLARFPEVLLLSYGLMGIGVFLILKKGVQIKWPI